jgi:hypothetical protein
MNEGNITKLNNSINELDIHTKDIVGATTLLKYFTELQNDFKENKVLHDESLNNIIKARENLESSIADSKKGLDNINNTIQNNLIAMHQMYQDSENNLNSKIERYKSDTEVTIRNESVQIQRGIENTTISEFNKLDGKIKERFGSVDELFKKQNKIIYGILGITILNLTFIIWLIMR